MEPENESYRVTLKEVSSSRGLSLSGSRRLCCMRFFIFSNRCDFYNSIWGTSQNHITRGLGTVYYPNLTTI